MRRQFMIKVLLITFVTNLISECLLMLGQLIEASNFYHLIYLFGYSLLWSVGLFSVFVI